MILELSIWTTAKFLIKLTRKFGKDWLKKNFGFDNETADLIYAGVDDPTKFGDLMHHLQKNKNTSTVIESKISEIEKLPEVKEEPNLLLPGSKVDEYKELLDDIFKVVIIRKHPIVIEGFLNGTEYISYFSLDWGEYGITKKQGFLELNAFTVIEIEKIPEETERKKRLIEQRLKSKDNRFNNKYDKLIQPSYKIEKVYDDYIEVKYQITRRDETKDMSNSEANIDNYDGFTLMYNSLQEYITEIVTNVRNLRDLSNRK